MNNPKIVAAEVGPYPKSLFDDMPWVKVTLKDGVELKLFQFYPDEIDFSPSEFLGLTVRQAHALRHKKDVRYLQS